ncbi:MAG TPA: hypothetical protein DFS52_03300 [Myxococcales bacterium]|jgi:hypothetical protein|nr:hypothetical protein [Myxococcales bacterium]
MFEHRPFGPLLAAAFVLSSAACGGEEQAPARVSIKNDFANPEMARNPPWTICKAAFQGVDFGKIAIDATSEEKEVEPGLDYVLMVAAWDDPDCDPAHALPIASKNEEEVVPGQRRTIAINMPNHQGPCPPEGVAPIPEAVYERIRERWPELGFKAYAERTLNPQCAK